MDLKTYRYLLGAQRALAHVYEHCDDPDIHKFVGLAYSYLAPPVTAAQAWFASPAGQAALLEYTDRRIRRGMKRRATADIRRTVRAMKLKRFERSQTR